MRATIATMLAHRRACSKTRRGLYALAYLWSRTSSFKYIPVSSSWVDECQLISVESVYVVQLATCFASRARLARATMITSWRLLECVNVSVLRNCSTQPTMTSSTASKPTLHTSSSLTFLTRLIFRTVFALAIHNMTTINKTKFLNDADFIICMLYKYSCQHCVN